MSNIFQLTVSEIAEKIIIKNILNKKNFKKLNIDIHKNKRYLLTPLESAKKFVKLI